MTMHLVVVRPFGQPAKGDMIAAAADCSAVRGRETTGRVVRAARPVPALNEAGEG